MRMVSDNLCSDYGLSVLGEQNSNRSNAFVNKYTNSNKSLIEVKQDIDYAIYRSNNYIEFIKFMKNLGYRIIDDGVKFSISNKMFKRNIRPERRFEKEYSIKSFEDIEKLKESKQSELSNYKSSKEELQRENRRNIPEDKKNENDKEINELKNNKR